MVFSTRSSHPPLAESNALQCCKKDKEKAHTCTILFKNNKIVNQDYLDILNPKIPSNAYASGSTWKCVSGYFKSNKVCKKVPLNATAISSGYSWNCNYGYKASGNRCIKSNIPVNAFASGNNWKCVNGYFKSGNKCEKAPLNSITSSSGYSWKCIDGYFKSGKRCEKSEESLDYIEELKQIKLLFDSGIISQDEFEQMKQKIINNM